MPEPIHSTANPRIKQLVALQEKSRLRRETGLFVVEGRRELEQCAAAGYAIDSVFVCPEIFGPGCCEEGLDGGGVFPQRTVATRGHVSGRGPDARSIDENPFSEDATKRTGGMRTEGPTVRRGKNPTPADTTVFHVSRAVYDKIAYRGGTEGILATVRCRALNLDELALPENPLLIVLEAVEKPGNLGAILRSADAARADAVLVCDPLTDLYNPNLIRASLGACFTVPTVAVSSKEAIAWLKAHGIRILSAQLQDSSLYYAVDMQGGTALVMGAESTGLSELWRAAADAHIRIPMLGTVDSLNVSVSAAILLFEAVRQRAGQASQATGLKPESFLDPGK